MPSEMLNSYKSGPDEKGRFGDFGGRFVSETLMPLILDFGSGNMRRQKMIPAFGQKWIICGNTMLAVLAPLYYAEADDRGAGWCKNLP